MYTVIVHTSIIYILYHIIYISWMWNNTYHHISTHSVYRRQGAWRRRSMAKQLQVKPQCGWLSAGWSTPQPHTHSPCCFRLVLPRKSYPTRILDLSHFTKSHGNWFLDVQHLPRITKNADVMPRTSRRHLLPLSWPVSKTTQWDHLLCEGAQLPLGLQL